MSYHSHYDYSQHLNSSFDPLLDRGPQRTDPSSHWQQPALDSVTTDAAPPASIPEGSLQAPSLQGIALGVRYVFNLLDG